MKEAFEKIVERLEELKSEKEIGSHKVMIKEAIDIVNHVAEEYKSLTIEPKSLTMDDKKFNDGWIPCSERLPEKNGYYLCQRGRNNSYFQICGFAKNLKKVDKYDFKGEKRAGFYDYDSEYGCYETTGIIAWQPLPAPYKQEGE